VLRSKTFLVIGIVAALSCSSFATAQDYKVEVGGWFGYTFSEGVPIQNIEIDGKVYNKVDPTSGSSYGVSFGVFFTEQMQVEFVYDEQSSALQGSGPGGKREFVDMKLHNYHVNFVYNWGDDRDVMRPFIFGGLGATSFKPGDVMGSLSESNTRFSSSWGGGVKAYPSRNVGIKLMARWIPTYIKSEPGGIWCNPYWPWICYQLVDNQYVNQFEMSAGITLRF